MNGTPKTLKARTETEPVGLPQTSKSMVDQCRGTERHPPSHKAGLNMLMRQIIRKHVWQPSLVGPGPPATSVLLSPLSLSLLLFQHRSCSSHFDTSRRALRPPVRNLSISDILYHFYTFHGVPPCRSRGRHTVNLSAPSLLRRRSRWKSIGYHKGTGGLTIRRYWPSREEKLRPTILILHIERGLLMGWNISKRAGCQTVLYYLPRLPSPTPSPSGPSPGAVDV